MDAHGAGEEEVADEVTGSGATDVDVAALDDAALIDDDADEDPAGVASDGIGVAADGRVAVGLAERCLPRVRVGLSDGEELRRADALDERDGDLDDDRVGAAGAEVDAGGPCCGACWFE